MPTGLLILQSSTTPDKLGQELDAWEGGRFVALWQGLVWDQAGQSGADCARHICHQMETTQLGDICPGLHGTFGLFVYDREQHRWSVCGDNAGLFHLFYDTDSISTSFLSLVQQRPVNAGSRDSLADFLTHGMLIPGSTLVTGVSRLLADQWIELGPTGLTRHPKTLAPLPPQPIEERAFLGYFDTLAKALAGRRVSVDLTGGADSRLVAALLHATGLHFDVAISGMPTHPDVLCCQQAAHCMGWDCTPWVHNLDTLEADLERYFIAVDGRCDLLAYHRPGQLQALRKKLGYDTAIGGLGGELYKDFWWLQDFPRYENPKTRWERLYDLRIAPLDFPIHLAAPGMQGALRRVRDRTLEHLRSYRQNTNTQSYDVAYYHYKMSELSGSFISGHTKSFLPAVVPLLDYDNYRFAYALTRQERQFMRFQRRLIGGVSPALARLRTTEGTSLSPTTLAMLKDSLAHVTNRSRRVLKKVLQRTLGTTVGALATPNHPEIAETLRGTATFRSAIQCLAERRILASETTIHEVPATQIGKLLTLGMLLRHTELDLAAEGVE